MRCHLCLHPPPGKELEVNRQCGKARGSMSSSLLQWMSRASGVQGEQHVPVGGGSSDAGQWRTRSDIEDHIPQGSQNILDNMVVQCCFEVYIGTMLKKDMTGSEDGQSSRHIPVCSIHITICLKRRALLIYIMWFAIKLSKRQNNFTLFFGEPSYRVTRQKQICDQGYIRQIFTQNMENIFLQVKIHK
ncbi:uncharacterized protein [Triticum aestivum]|uniref:uncharacterized protein isoform X2 n=1 Tax=Triticum aestivum TaxID=4565 RepID=UPI001D02715F|nr:uncharacterized protein LOC123111361 isoform X2 [Triticum aestivum]